MKSQRGACTAVAPAPLRDNRENNKKYAFFDFTYMLPNTFLLQQLSRLACALDLAFSDKKYYQHRKIELIMLLAQISRKANGNVFFHS